MMEGCRVACLCWLALCAAGVAVYWAIRLLVALIVWVF